MPYLSENLKRELWVAGFFLILVGALGFLLYGLDNGLDKWAHNVRFAFLTMEAEEEATRTYEGVKLEGVKIE